MDLLRAAQDYGAPGLLILLVLFLGKQGWDWMMRLHDRVERKMDKKDCKEFRDIEDERWDAHRREAHRD